MKLRFAALLLSTSLAVQLHASSDVAARGKDLIDNATTKINIFELPSFRMKADVRIENAGKQLDGNYTLLWNNPDRWREEVAFPGYSEIQVGSKGTIYLKRTTSHMPYRVFQLHSLLGFGSGVALLRTSLFNQTLQPGETIKSVHQKTLAGQKADCVEILTVSKYSRQVCVDLKTGVLSRADRHLIDTDYSAIGEKLFPRSLTLEQNGRHIAEVHVTELKSGEPSDSSFFQPPPGAVSRPGCMNPVPGTKLKDVAPIYPPDDKMSHHEGVVGVYAVIDESGVPKELQKVASASPGLDNSAIDAIGKWRYAPATCNGKPVPVETVFEVIYTLQY